jgi:hypothetical protein
MNQAVLEHTDPTYFGAWWTNLTGNCAQQIFGVLLSDAK